MPIPPVPPQTSRAAKALNVFELLIATPAGRQAWLAGPEAAFNAHKAGLGAAFGTVMFAHIPLATLQVLQGLSEPELALLTRLDATYVADGLFIDVPAVGRAYYK
jgi:hypothetical protein